MNPRGDVARANAVLAAAAVQIAAGTAVGTGAWGEPVGTVAGSYPTLLLPAGGTFTIWSLIYVAFAGLALRQAVSGQLARPVHRRTGWWLAGAGLLAATWVVLFSHRLVVAAQVVLVALLACLATTTGLLMRTPARGWADRLALHTTVTLYTGWVVVATVAGAATTGAALGAGPSPAGAVIAVLLTGTSAASAASRLPAVAGFAAAVCWALVWIAMGTPDGAVRTGSIVAAIVVATAVAVRLRRSPDVAATAWG